MQAEFWETLDEAVPLSQEKDTWEQNIKIYLQSRKEVV